MVSEVRSCWYWRLWRMVDARLCKYAGCLKIRGSLRIYSSTAKFAMVAMFWELDYRKLLVDYFYIPVRFLCYDTEKNIRVDYYHLSRVGITSTKLIIYTPSFDLYTLPYIWFVVPEASMQT